MDEIKTEGFVDEDYSYLDEPDVDNTYEQEEDAASEKPCTIWDSRAYSDLEEDQLDSVHSISEAIENIDSQITYCLNTATKIAAECKAYRLDAILKHEQKERGRLVVKLWRRNHIGVGMKTFAIDWALLTGYRGSKARANSIPGRKSSPSMCIATIETFLKKNKCKLQPYEIEMFHMFEPKFAAIRDQVSKLQKARSVLYKLVLSRSSAKRTIN